MDMEQMSFLDFLIAHSLGMLGVIAIVWISVLAVVTIAKITR